MGQSEVNSVQTKVTHCVLFGFLFGNDSSSEGSYLNSYWFFALPKCEIPLSSDLFLPFLLIPFCKTFGSNWQIEFDHEQVSTRSVLLKGVSQLFCRRKKGRL